MAIIAVLVAAAATPAAANGPYWSGLGGAHDHSGRAWSDGGVPPMWLQYRTSDPSPVVTPPVLTASADPSRSRVAYGTADGRVHVRRLRDGAEVGPTGGILIDGGAHDDDVFGTPADGVTVGLVADMQTIFAVHNDGEHVEVAQIDAQTGTLLGDDPVPTTSGLTVRASPLLMDHCRSSGIHAPLVGAGVYFVAGDRLISVGVPTYGRPITQMTSVDIPGANPLATPGATDCEHIVVSRTGGLSIVRDGSLDGQTPQDVALDPGSTPGTPSLIGTRLLVPVASGATTTVVAVDAGQSPPAVVDHSPALPGSPGPALAGIGPSSTYATERSGVVVLGTSANLYLLTLDLDEITRVSPDTLTGDQGFGTVAPSIVSPGGWADDARYRIYAQRSDGTALALDGVGHPLPVSDFAPPSHLGTPGQPTIGQPAPLGGQVVFSGPQGLAVFTDRDVTPPTGSVGAAPTLSGTAVISVYPADNRLLSWALVTATKIGVLGPIQIGFAPVDADGGPWLTGSIFSAGDGDGLQMADKTVSWDTTKVADGDYRFDTILVDAAGNRTVLNEPTVSVRNGKVVAPPKPPVVLRKGRCANVRTGRGVRDRMVGTAAGDRLRGLGGNDSISGGAGADCLEGGAGNDRLHGGSGNDRLVGGAGNDWLSGDSGANVIDGGAGNDVVRAVNRARDVVTCGSGRDTVYADRGDHVSRTCERVHRRARR